MYERKSVRRSIHEDVKNYECFFDSEAFAEVLNINGRKVLGILTQSKHSRVYDSLSGVLMNSGMVMFLRASEVAGVNVNEVLKVNGKSYLVRDARVLGDSVWRIELGAYET